ncbi:hypothetical protein CWO90_18090 [Bradyrhizobium sp. Leo121]|nr:hypothetical protein CWO90_18090 [Bradyrhizobium sp. Leo121]
MAGLVPAIHVSVHAARKHVDARDKPRHDGATKKKARNRRALRKTRVGRPDAIRPSCCRPWRNCPARTSHLR